MIILGFCGCNMSVKAGGRSAPFCNKAAGAQPRHQRDLEPQNNHKERLQPCGALYLVSWVPPNTNRDRLHFKDTVHMPERSTIQQAMQHQHHQIVGLTPRLCNKGSYELLNCHRRDYRSFAVSKKWVKTFSLGTFLGKIMKLGYEPDILTFTTLIRGLCIGGKLALAVRFFDEIVKNGFQPDLITYGTLINGLCKTGET
ncbi:hypothetical protein LguiA_029228 [Lonicera macranthoides]